ncbi:Hypothetical predicted protein [Mytilus galloprovincialis]|nr:Hypothetical predicted protein [Mytilus galloprovincialis]
MSSPDSTAKTADSGIESLAKRLSEDTQLGSSLGSSPLPPTTENDQVDHALVYHLVYCERLLESLGVYGPLKCREIYALDRLQKQADIIDSLIKISENGSDIDLLSVMSSLTEDKSLREFWARCTDQNLLYIQPEKLVTCLDQKYGAQLRSKYERDPKRVLRHLVMRLLDVPNYDPETIKPTCIVTLHQFMTYFKEEGGLQHVDAVASEINMIEKLCCEDSDTVIKTILQLKDVLPQPQCIKILGVLLMGSDTEIADYIESYLRKINKNKESRDKALVVFAEGLEDKTSEIRAGSCKALQILEATESIDRLAYICQTDRSTTVQDQAKAALTSLGEDGRQAFDVTQLTTHGFQGIQVQK